MAKSPDQAQESDSTTSTARSRDVFDEIPHPRSTASSQAKPGDDMYGLLKDLEKKVPHGAHGRMGSVRGAHGYNRRAQEVQGGASDGASDAPKQTFGS